MRSKMVKILGLAALASMMVVSSAFAAPDPLTGIDPTAEVGDIVASAKTWILAGVVVFVLGAAITLGKRYVGKFGVRG